MLLLVLLARRLFCFLFSPNCEQQTAGRGNRRWLSFNLEIGVLEGVVTLVSGHSIANYLSYRVLAREYRAAINNYGVQHSSRYMMLRPLYREYPTGTPTEADLVSGRLLY
jgi:hypothetical protein